MVILTPKISKAGRRSQLMGTLAYRDGPDRRFFQFVACFWLIKAPFSTTKIVFVKKYNCLIISDIINYNTSFLPLFVP